MNIAYNYSAMNKAKIKNLETGQFQNGENSNGQRIDSKNGSEESKAYRSAMKAFTMTNKRLHPKLYKGNSKLGKVRS